MPVHQSLDCSVVVVICGCESYFLWGVLVVIICGCESYFLWGVLVVICCFIVL